MKPYGYPLLEGGPADCGGRLVRLKDILYLRGVFKTWHSRVPQARPTAAGPKLLASSRAGISARLDETGQQVLRQLLHLMKPHLRV